MSNWADWLPNDDTKPTDATRLYAEHGAQPIPIHGTILAEGAPPACTCKEGAACENIGKHPALSSWQKTATSDPIAAVELRRGRGVPKAANVGLALGGDARLVAVDLDGPSGRAAFEIMRAGRFVPETLTNESGRLDGGEHRVFEVPAHQDLSKLRNRASLFKERFGKGLDVRGQGGQIVVAPSVHASGRRYRWRVRVAPALLPDWLYEELTAERAPDEPLHAPLGTGDVVAPMTDARKVAYWQTVLENAGRDMSSAGKGGRNELLFSKACKLFELVVGEGFARVDVSNVLEPAAIAAGLSKGEARKTIAQAWKQVGSGPGTRMRDLPALLSAGSSRAPSDAPPPAPEDWEEQHEASDNGLLEATLTRGKNGNVKATATNVSSILEMHAAWRGIIAYDDFAGRTIARAACPTAPGKVAPPAGPWEERHTRSAVRWLQSEYGIDATLLLVDEAVEYVGDQHTFHPARDYFEGLVWDGVARLDTWLVEHAHAADTAFVRGASAMWAISAVARVYQPGCQVDHVLVIEGEQGHGKSTAIRTLVGDDWFSATLPDIGTKDAMQELGGKLVFELAELASMKGAAVEKVKTFFTTTIDHYRPSYGRRSVARPRQCVFTATTNEGQYLPDRTGNRRFWPVLCRGEVDRVKLAAARDQLWAEAVARYKGGEQWWPTAAFKALATAQQEAREVADAWDEALADWIRKPMLVERAPDGMFREVRAEVREGIRMVDALAGIRKGAGGLATRADEMRLGACFRKLGYDPALVGLDRRRLWRKVEARTIAGTITERHGETSSGSDRDRPEAPRGPFPQTIRNEYRGESGNKLSPPPALPCVYDKKDDQVDQVDQRGKSTGENRDQPCDHPHAQVDQAFDPLADDLFDDLVSANAGKPAGIVAPVATAVAPGPLSSSYCTCFAEPGQDHEAWCELSAVDA